MAVTKTLSSFTANTLKPLDSGNTVKSMIISNLGSVDTSVNVWLQQGQTIKSAIAADYTNVATVTVASTVGVEAGMHVIVVDASGNRITGAGGFNGAVLVNSVTNSTTLVLNTAVSINNDNNYLLAFKKLNYILKNIVVPPNVALQVFEENELFTTAAKINVSTNQTDSINVTYTTK